VPDITWSNICKQLDTTTRQQIGCFLAAARTAGDADVRNGGGAWGEHDLRWLDILADAMGHQPIVIIDRDVANNGTGDICGYLPLVLVKTRLFGRFLVSLPYLNRAGIVANNDAVRDRILGAAIELAREHNVQYLELRQHDHPIDHSGITHTRDEKVAMILELPTDEEELWTTFSAKVRNQIRWGGRELLDDLYNIFAVNMRDRVTPVYPRKIFAGILEKFPDDAELAIVDYQGAAIAGGLLVHDTARGYGMTQVPSASCLRRFNATNANMWMYHHLLKRAIMRNSRQFDFGRSTPDSGTYSFKKQWGAKAQPTYWQYHLRHGQLDAVRPDNPKYQRRIAAWQKLPVWVTRMAGPAIVRGIP
jgi:serine/alanine adding enzyme